MLELREVERRCNGVVGDFGDFGGGVGGLSRGRSPECKPPVFSPLSPFGSNESEFWSEASNEAPSSIAPSARAPCRDVEAPSTGAPSGGTPPLSAFSPSPSKNIRESLITLSVGRLEWPLRRAPNDDGDVAKLRALVVEGGSDCPDAAASSHGSSGKWAPGRPLRTCGRLRPSAHQHVRIATRFAA